LAKNRQHPMKKNKKKKIQGKRDEVGVNTLWRRETGRDETQTSERRIKPPRQTTIGTEKAAGKRGRGKELTGNRSI